MNLRPATRNFIAGAMLLPATIFHSGNVIAKEVKQIITPVATEYNPCTELVKVIKDAGYSPKTIFQRMSISKGTEVQSPTVEKIMELSGQCRDTALGNISQKNISQATSKIKDLQVAVALTDGHNLMEKISEDFKTTIIASAPKGTEYEYSWGTLTGNKIKGNNVVTKGYLEGEQYSRLDSFGFPDRFIPTVNFVVRDGVVTFK
ncbi:MAG TPA: hypothetical protein DDW90_08935 [Cyanobacteria bacterium UBA9971]|nr:hypothetical protein [Cyanobacteria bacterium UBA9971]